MDLDLRAVTDDEFVRYSRVLDAAFGVVPTDQQIEVLRPLTELDRTLAVFDDGRIVATAGAVSFRMTVPGGASVDAAGVTAVSVLPTHRRRGLLRTMMDRQLDDVATRGEALAILLASESGIYRRFGYGLATRATSVSIDKSHGAFASPVEYPGRLRMIDGAEAARIVPPVHESARLRQPGDVNRSSAWWDYEVADHEWNRRGLSALFWVVCEAPGGTAEGYATWRVKENWPEGIAANELRLVDLVAVDDKAEAALWRFVLDVDLVHRVECRLRPVDEALRWRLAEPRQLRTTTVRDFLWVRVLDVAVALAARTYACDGEVVLDVADALRPSNGGRYRLAGGPTGARCRPSDDPPDLALDVADLGAVYLSGTSFTMLAKAGRLTELRDGATARADAMFATAVPPFCRTDF
ncbi:MAG TPA: GNAT family N-acetyltransferase [Acidimicrobiales bacterium]|nr:GNAT family N-acetyltransferase [Acidimicrobiales bacterium]